MNPTRTELSECNLDLIVSGNEETVVMVEGEADFISEEDFLSIMKYGHDAIKDIISLLY